MRFQDPGWKKFGSGMNILDPQHCLCPLIKGMFWNVQVIEPQFQRDFISLLPKELALYVLAFLHPKDLLRSNRRLTGNRI
jgi:hypothetical protein